MTFKPEAVDDNYSLSQNEPGLCGALVPSKFSCVDLSAEKAYLDATSGDATIKLNWDSALKNDTLSCNFEYTASQYEDAVWVGDSFDVKINDPCIQEITYTVTTAPDLDLYEYGMG